MTTQAMLDDRYGRTLRPRRRRAFWIVVATLAAAAIAALAWVTIANSIDAVSFDDTGHEIIDEREVRVSFQVTPPAGRGFACALEALDEQFGVVGWRVVSFEGSEQTTRAFSETVPTLALATTGIVNSCWAR